ADSSRRTLVRPQRRGIFIAYRRTLRCRVIHVPAPAIRIAERRRAIVIRGGRGHWVITQQRLTIGGDRRAVGGVADVIPDGEGEIVRREDVVVITKELGEESVRAP